MPRALDGAKTAASRALAGWLGGAIAAVLALFLGAPLVRPAGAWTTLTAPCEFRDARAFANTSGIGFPYQIYEALVDWGVDRWNGAVSPRFAWSRGTGVAISPRDRVYFYTYSLNDGHGAVFTQPGCAGGADSDPGTWSGEGRIGINTYYAAQYGGAVGGIYRATIVHEMGHPMGLGHVDPACGTGWNRGIMHPDSRVWTVCGWDAPRTDDVAGIQAIYSSGGGK